MVMFIKEIDKRNSTSDKTFVYHRLMEAVRTPRGPRQHIVINLGRLDIPKEDWKTLANRIEEILSGQVSFLSPAPHIESLAQHYAGLLRQKEMQSIPLPQEAEWEKVNLNSLSQGEFRTIGGEAVAYDAFNRLGIAEILAQLGFKEKQIHQAALLIIGRLLHPSSERETAMWGKQISALDELLGADFEHLSNNALYRISDELVKHRDDIENLLAQRERETLGLGEKIILYDLTNTYLTGRAHESSRAHRGHSKEKRDDCPLLTLALVLDEEGFPKKSQVLAGNTSEPGSLKGFLEAYKSELSRRLPLFKELPTVVIDAGVGTQDNLRLIREEGFQYITVSRSRPTEAPTEELVMIRDGKDSTIKAKRLDRDGEVILYCESSARARKEESIKTRFQKRFEEGLEAISSSLTKKTGHKRYGRVMERIGRLRERYPTIARFYKVDVQEEKGKVSRVGWSIDGEKELEARFSGSYYIRSSRTDLNEKELWSLYMMLGQIEESFRCLKSELGLRPVFHRKDSRQEGHLFVSVLAYHLMAIVQRDLRRKGLSYRWGTLRTRLSTHMRATASVTNEKGERIHLRQTGDPEPFHLEIHHALGLSAKPLKTKRMKM
ncbi:MAG: IS1634 family transposase [Deltaproteobacteria bacterium]